MKQPKKNNQGAEAVAGQATLWVKVLLKEEGPPAWLQEKHEPSPGFVDLGMLALLNDHARLVDVLFQNEVITEVPPQLESFAASIVSEFDRVAALKYNWDSMGAHPIEKKVLRLALKWLLDNATAVLKRGKARKKLVAPAIYARPLGSIDLLWETEHANLLVNVGFFDGVGKAMFFAEVLTGSEKGDIIESSISTTGEPRSEFVEWLQKNVSAPSRRRIVASKTRIKSSSATYPKH